MLKTKKRKPLTKIVSGLRAHHVTFQKIKLVLPVIRWISWQNLFTPGDTRFH